LEEWWEVRFLVWAGELKDLNPERGSSLRGLDFSLLYRRWGFEKGENVPLKVAPHAEVNTVMARKVLLILGPRGRGRKRDYGWEKTRLLNVANGGKGCEKGVKRLWEGGRKLKGTGAMARRNSLEGNS